MVAAMFLAAPFLRAGAPVAEINGDILTILPGNYTSPLAYDAGAVSAYNNGNFSITGIGGDTNTVVKISSGDTNAGGNSGFANLTNNGTIELTGSGGQTGSVNVLWVSAAGASGAAGTSGNDPGQSGGSAAGGTGLWNNAPVTLTGGSAFPFGVVVLLAEALGGNGGAGAGSGIGGAGGGAENDPAGDYLVISNTAPIAVGSPQQGHIAAVPASGDGRFSLMRAFGLGGNGGTNGGAGGGAGPVSTSSESAGLWAYWTPQPGGDADTFFGIESISRGGSGSASSVNERNGGAGGGGGNATISLVNTPSLTISAINGTAAGAALFAQSSGGDGGMAWSHSAGGAGGTAALDGGASVYIQNSNVSARGDGIAGSVAEAIGGMGGNGTSGQYQSNGGGGGAAGGAFTAVSAASGSNSSITTSGSNAPAVVVRSTGGRGGVGGSLNSDETTYAGAGGEGGDAGEATVEIGNVSTSPADDGQVFITAGGGDFSPGILAYSQGGNGGYSGEFNGPSGDVRNGGNGENGSTVNVSIGEGSSVHSSGTSSSAILARSVGGAGGTGGPTSTIDRGGADGGAGGNSGAVIVTVGLQANILAGGANSAGIAAQSISGAGGAGGNATNAGGGRAGSGGAGGNSSDVSVTNHGYVGTGGVLDIANDAIGILAQSLSGSGGVSGNATGAFFSEGGTGSASGITGNVTVVQKGLVTTGPAAFWPPQENPGAFSPLSPSRGQASHGILAQSIAGGGGAAGSAGGLVSLGGSANSNPARADGNSVSVANTGGIGTFGNGALGIIAQSVGGGGGDGGSSNGLLSIGGVGGGGGNGGSTIVTSSNGTIETWGAQSIAVLGQSIGGGGW